MNKKERLAKVLELLEKEYKKSRQNFAEQDIELTHPLSFLSSCF